jgi:hypothetical protein
MIFPPMHQLLDEHWRKQVDRRKEKTKGRSIWRRDAIVAEELEDARRIITIIGEPSTPGKSCIALVHRPQTRG